MQYKRDDAIDFVKGFFVIGMAVYHTTNYFVLGNLSFYNYFSYVPQGFIFLSGFICASIYYRKFQEDRGYVVQRLVSRAFKLILIFLAINLTILTCVRKVGFLEGRGGSSVWEWMEATLLKGLPHVSSFEILVPIAYVLLLSPVFLALARYRKYYIYAVAALFIFIGLIKLEAGYNLSCLLVGIGGIAVGFVFDSLRPWFENIYFRIAAGASLLLFFLILIPRGFNVRSEIIVVFVFICVVTSNLYILGSLLNAGRFPVKQVCEMGRYSLMLYIFQVVLLRLGKVLLGITWSSIGIGFWSLVLACTMAMVAMVEITIFLRRRIALVDKAYRLVFG